jgi:hypothetical protein
MGCMLVQGGAHMLAMGRGAMALGPSLAHGSVGIAFSDCSTATANHNHTVVDKKAEAKYILLQSHGSRNQQHVLQHSIHTAGPTYPARPCLCVCYTAVGNGSSEACDGDISSWKGHCCDSCTVADKYKHRVGHISDNSKPETRICTVTPQVWVPPFWEVLYTK